ncbi:DEAD/DEAH box helicase family protein [Bacillus sp. RO2]|uniref:DEAD/DEAH box helicase family protein n=1 Tax=Bacillus sp. RO2 TaxID=2723913 RepID=UPI00145C45E2|nr:DEAD/DEAH box helicase family protein [Bacillus sp. RO2]NMH73557.1 DEAD/DEAH box helicase family protein [Bacillus sp. RO2]
MSLKELNISYQYRTGHEEGNIIENFYIPVLSKSILYKRAVGYFSSGSLMLAAKGISELIGKGGKMQLIASPHLEEEDIEMIESGYKLRERVIEESLLRSLDIETYTPLQRERLNYLAWLIANDSLDIKIAVMSDSKKFGIYHEKLGIMEDTFGNKVAFSGSSNETEGGLYNNFESIDVFCSWLPNEKIRVEQKNNDFNKLWNNKTNYLEVMDFPQAVKEKILSYKISTYKKIDPELIVRENQVNYGEKYPVIPKGYLIRDYQQEAIRCWFRNECQGLLEMATGTGKTITALSAISKLWEVSNRLGVIIVCPYTHLVDQWVEDIKRFNMEPIVAYSSRSLWEEDLSNSITAFQSGITKHFCLITTNSTYSSKHMQLLIKRLNGDVVFVADEAHHLGAENNRNKLIKSIPYRLALSATPNRWFDEEGTTKLIDYFGGKTVFEFGLDKAIEKGFLTQYFYYPHLVYLDEDESELYYEITRKLVKIFPKDGNVKGEDAKSAQSLLIERARILSRARNKLSKLKELMNQEKISKHNIVYCGDSWTDGEKQIDAVVKLLGNELDMRVHTFTSREDKQQRKQLLQKFEEGDLQVLVAIKCLDEGVDVPATQRAYILSSSTNPREFIQRRGRVLRKHKSKEYSYIHDFIVIPRNLDEIRHIEPSLFNMERKMVIRELNRFLEFADIAINGPVAHESILEFKKAYHLLDV